MPDIGTTATMASLIVGMLAIPAASQGISGEKTILESPANISEANNPRSVEISKGPNGFKKKVETAFNTFKAQYNSRNASATLESPKAMLDVTKKAGKTVWKLETSEGSLEITKTSNKVVKVVKTAEGTLETSKKNGVITENFEGDKKDLVEQRKQELEKLMSKKLQKARGKLGDTENSRKESGSIKIDFMPESPEHVILKNNGTQEIDLEGWKLQNNNPSNYTFGDISLEDGEELKVYSEQKSDLNVSENTSVYGTGLSWENSGDTATLRDTDNQMVERNSY